MSGKGDRDRSDPRKFAAGYDYIFNRCPKHPEYHAKRKPTADCDKCHDIYRRRQK